MFQGISRNSKEINVLKSKMMVRAKPKNKGMIGRVHNARNPAADIGGILVKPRIGRINNMLNRTGYLRRSRTQPKIGRINNMRNASAYRRIGPTHPILGRLHNELGDESSIQPEDRRAD